MTREWYRSTACSVVSKQIRNCKRLRADGYQPAPLSDTWEMLVDEMVPFEMSRYQWSKLKRYIRQDVALRKVIG